MHIGLLMNKHFLTIPFLRPRSPTFVRRGIEGVVSLALLFLSTITASHANDTIEIFVSILPQQYFVERIGGDKVNVHVMVKPGQSPSTFEPTPKLMSLYSKTDIFFTIGMPFEKVWIDRVASLNKNVAIIETQPQRSKAKDPHTWLSPVLVQSQAKIIMLALSQASPQNKEIYSHNFNKLKKELDVLHESNKSIFKGSNKTRFMTFHPAFSYFSDLYGLKQIAIESKGKEPSAKQMSQLVGHYRDKQVPYVLIEKQFNQLVPKTVAKSLNSELLAVDPLAKDYISNMNDIAEKIHRSLF